MFCKSIGLASVFIVATVVGGSGIALAGPSEDDGDGDGGDDRNADGDSADGDGGGELGRGTSLLPGMIVPKGMIEVNVGLNLGVGAAGVGNPTSLNPDVRYGLAPKLDAGLFHSSVGISGYWVGEGGGLCVSGPDNGCPKAFNGPTGILANYSLVEGKFALAANGGLLLNAYDPFVVGLKAGVVGRYDVNDKMVVNFAPNLYIGISHRSAHKELVNLPVSVGYAVSPKVQAGVQTGIAGPLDGFGNAFTVPVNVGGTFALNHKMGVGAAFGFINLLGQNSTADARALSLYFMWHN